LGSNFFFFLNLKGKEGFLITILNADSLIDFKLWLVTGFLVDGYIFQNLSGTEQKKVTSEM
jgi:hypothetical protein